MIEQQSNMLYQLFSMEEEEKQNRKLYRLLAVALLTINVDRDIITLQFSNKIEVKITIYEFHFYIDFSDKSLFQNGENKETKQSKDRILYYLEYIGNLRS